MTIGTLLSNVGGVLTAMLGWMADIFDTAISSPIVLFFLATAIIGVAVGFVKKLMHV